MINFEYDNVSASQRLEEFASKKLDKLFSVYANLIVDADVYFKNENTSSPDTGKVCGIRLNIKRGSLFSQASRDSYEASLHETIDELTRQLRKTKEKMRSY